MECRGEQDGEEPARRREGVPEDRQGLCPDLPQRLAEVEATAKTQAPLTPAGPGARITRWPEGPKGSSLPLVLGTGLGPVTAGKTETNPGPGLQRSSGRSTEGSPACASR